MRTAARNSSTPGIAAFAFGAVAGVLAGRLLPPIAAAASGSARARAGFDPFDALAADHRRFLDLLEEMAESRSDARIQRIQLLLRLKRRLAAHAMAEEDVIYPLLADEAAASDDARKLYSEHADIKMRLYRLERMSKTGPEWASEARALREVIAEHARHEEEVDFPALRRALDEKGRTHLARDLYREKALVL